MTFDEQAIQCRQVFNQEILPNISHYGFIKKKLWDMQIRLIDEEFQEFGEAAEQCFADPENADRRTELLKELADLVFVCYQFASAFGLDLDKAMALIFESNMSKLDEQGKAIFRPDGKVLKGPNYAPPDLTSCVPSNHSNLYDTYGK